MCLFIAGFRLLVFGFWWFGVVVFCLFSVVAGFVLGFGIVVCSLVVVVCGLIGMCLVDYLLIVLLSVSILCRGNHWLLFFCLL